MNWIRPFLEIGTPICLIVIGYLVGGSRERKHYARLRMREHRLLSRVPMRSDCGPKLHSGEVFLVEGSVVVASDYFKNFIGNLRNFFGGRMASHESLLDRARREAVCRMRERALKQGANQVIDVHIETSFLDQLGVEVSAYGTAVRS